MTAADFIALKNAQIQKIAAKGRAWIAAEGKELKAALARQGGGTWEDGTRASIQGQIEDLRAAWKLAK